MFDRVMEADRLVERAQDLLEEMDKQTPMNHTEYWQTIMAACAVAQALLAVEASQ